MITVTMSKVAAFAALRHLRHTRDVLTQDRDLLARRHETIGDGRTNDAIVVLEGELYLVEEAIAAIWRAYNA